MEDFYKISNWAEREAIAKAKCNCPKKYEDCDRPNKDCALFQLYRDLQEERLAAIANNKQ